MGGTVLMVTKYAVSTNSAGPSLLVYIIIALLSRNLPADVAGKFARVHPDGRTHLID